MKKILMVGGGSGGHILPVVPVARELKRILSKTEIKFWCDKKSYSVAVNLFNPLSIKVETIASGKFRRYHHLKWWQHITMVSIIFIPNIIDIFKIVGGLIQSFCKLIIWRPDVIFAKGGFVCLPVGLAARILGIKIIIHDSDVVPGLTNRILAKFAIKIATGTPTKYYNYPKTKTVFTGIPTRSEFKPIDLAKKTALKKRLKLTSKYIVLVMGGGQGSIFLNTHVLKTAKLAFKNIQFVLIAGNQKVDEVKQQLKMQRLDNVLAIGFTDQIADYVLASDVVIGRAGATTISEFGLSHKPAILVPNHRLTGNHQIKNAQMLERERAAIILTEAEIENDESILINNINYILDKTNAQKVQHMIDRLSRLAKKTAATDLANIIANEAKCG